MTAFFRTTATTPTTGTTQQGIGPGGTYGMSPPSAYRRGGLMPGNNDEKMAKRNSRVDMDFEEALRSEDTFILYEGRDLNRLGSMSSSPPTGAGTVLDISSFSPPLQTTEVSHTPTSAVARKLKKPHHNNPVSPSPATGSTEEPNSGRPSTSSLTNSDRHHHDQREYVPNATRQYQGPPPNLHVEDFDTKRRSMFRSPGTASSPDLATLVKRAKARERASVLPPPTNKFVMSTNDEEQQQDRAREMSRERDREMGRIRDNIGERERNMEPHTDAGPSAYSIWQASFKERQRTLSNSKENKNQKTIRAKTSNFLTKVFGSTSVRDRSHTTTNTSSPFSHYPNAPPVPSVPALPEIYRSPQPTPTPTSAATSAAMSELLSPMSSQTMSETHPTSPPMSPSPKPLPPLRSGTADTENDNDSDIVLVERPGLTPNSSYTSANTATYEGQSKAHPQPQPPLSRTQLSQLKKPTQAVARALKAGRRRSVSVGDGTEQQWHRRIGNAAVDLDSADQARQHKEDSRNVVKSKMTGITEDEPEPASTSNNNNNSSMAWENALKGFDEQMANLEIRDPTTAVKVNSSQPPKLPAPTTERSSSRKSSEMPPTIGAKRTGKGTVSGQSALAPNIPNMPSPSPTASAFHTPMTTPTIASPLLSVSAPSPSSATVSAPSTPATSSPVASPTTPVNQTKRAGSSHTTFKTLSPTVAVGGNAHLPARRASTSAATMTTSIQTTSRSHPYHTSSPNSLHSSESSAVGPRQGQTSPVSYTHSPAQSPSQSFNKSRAHDAELSPGRLSPVSKNVSRNGVGGDSENGPTISLSLTSPSRESLLQPLRNLKAQRGPAIWSEPSLIPPPLPNMSSNAGPTAVGNGYANVGGSRGMSEDGGGNRTVRLVPTLNMKSHPGRRSWNRDPDGRGEKDRDLTTDDLITTRIHLGGSVASPSSTSSPLGSSRPSLSAASGMGNSGAPPSGIGMDPEELEARGEQLAHRLWNEDESFYRNRERYSEWLGGLDPLNAATLRHYIDYFDFGGLRVDQAFRRLCSKLYLRAETQIIDRILVEFSRRYWEHNPRCILGSSSNVHQLVYSIMLLNTDLHMAEISQRMTKHQFVSNTMSTITAPHPDVDSPTEDGDSVIGTGPAESPGRRSSLDPVGSNSSDHNHNQGNHPPISQPQLLFGTAGGGSGAIRAKRSGSVHSWKGSTRDSLLVTPSSTHLSPSGPGTGVSSRNSSAVSVALTQDVPNMPPKRYGSGNDSISSLQFGKGWEAEVEAYLKDIYAAVKSGQIMQPMGIAGNPARGPTQRMMRSNDRLATLKRGSIRGLQSLMAAQNNVNSSSSSIDGRISPSPSFATSMNDGMTASSSTLFTPALGFASNLTHTIIREAQEDDLRSVKSGGTGSTSVSISDEELALLGAPWAKEGMLTRKQQFETAGKKAKNNKHWMDVFVVIQKGHLRMFTFGGDSGSGGGGGESASHSVVGGGNWLKNAHPAGDFPLAHSLTQCLPPPGITRRLNCFVLTLPSGAVYFFQAGTEELANEWVSTCNYWAARQSKEPLAGGVSNMEYGWNRVEQDQFPHDDDGGADEDGYDGEKQLPITPISAVFPGRPTGEYAADTFSIKSGRSGRARLGGVTARLGEAGATLRGGTSPLVDKVYINDWKPPIASTVASTHDEETQLEALQRQAAKLKEDIKKHKDIQGPMNALYNPKSSNAIKANANWECKSKYLLTEVFKYDTYVDSLKSAMKERLKRRGEKALERALNATPREDDPDLPGSAQKEAFSEADATALGGDGPATPGPLPNRRGSHRRETADASSRY